MCYWCCSLRSDIHTLGLTALVCWFAQPEKEKKKEKVQVAKCSLRKNSSCHKNINLYIELSQLSEANHFLLFLIAIWGGNLFPPAFGLLFL